MAQMVIELSNELGVGDSPFATHMALISYSNFALTHQFLRLSSNNEQLDYTGIIDNIPWKQYVGISDLN